MKRECPECGSKNVMGYAEVTGRALINLSDLSVDEPPDEFDKLEENEVYEFICQDCDWEWDEEYRWSESFKALVAEADKKHKERLNKSQEGEIQCQSK